MREEPTRRKVLKGLAGAALVAGGGAYLLSQHPDKTDGHIEEGLAFPDGTVYRPAHVERTLTKWYEDNKGEDNKVKPLFENLNFNNTSAEYRKQLRSLREYRSNFTREGVPALVREFVEEDKAHRFKNEEDIKGALGKKFLVPVEEINSSWRCRGVGVGDSAKNDWVYLRLTPQTANALQKVAKQFQEKVRDAGLAPGWGVRFTINSLLRTEDPTDKTLAGYSSPDSPHLVGMGFDISTIRFDLIHKPDNAFLMFGSRDREQTSVHDSIVITLNHLLVQILEDMHEKEEIILTYEPARVHYHITSRRP